MTKIIMRALAPVTLALILAGCGGTSSSSEAGEKAGVEKTEGAGASEAKEGPKDAVTLSAQQIADAGIEVTRPTVGGVAGAIELSATIEGDPQGVQVVSASVGVSSRSPAISANPLVEATRSPSSRAAKRRHSRRRSRPLARERPLRNRTFVGSSGCSPNASRRNRISSRRGPRRRKPILRCAWHSSNCPRPAAGAVRSTVSR